MWSDAQTLDLSLQSAVATHATHALLFGSHAGVAPVQAATFEGLHCAQEPAPAPAVWQTPPFLLFAQSESLAHGVHM